MLDVIGGRIGAYDIIAWLGEGAHVQAYLARHHDTSQSVCVKILKDEFTRTPELLARFRSEATAALALHHPNIVTLYGFDQQGDTLYMVEEFKLGGSLLDRLKAQPGPQPTAFVLSTLEQIATALDLAHARGIIHRDLKPENILYDSDGTAALSDLGITKNLSSEAARSRAGLEFGNPGYMSPEAWQGGPVDARTDVYALGVIAFEMLAGQPPFNPETATSVMYIHLHHLTTEPLSLRTLRPDLPPTVQAVLNKAMHKLPEGRYASAGEFVADLRALA
jgi:serine/threonine-protein kinase